MGTRRGKHDRQRSNIGGGHRVLFWLAMGSFILALLFIGKTFARYIQVKSTGNFAEAEAFYFESDLLRPKADRAAYKMYDWGDGIRVQLRNYQGDSITNEDIAYDISVVNATYQVKQGNHLISGTTGEKILPKGKKNIADLIVMPKDGATEVTLTAKSKAPYVQALTATFHLMEIGDGTYFEVRDGGASGAAELIVKTGRAIHGTIVLPGSGLIPDNTNPMMRDWMAGASSHRVSFEANRTYSFLFFKNDPTISYRINQTVLEDGGTIRLGRS